MPGKPFNRSARLVLAAGFFVLFIGGGARFAVGLTLKPIVDDFGWGRSDLGLAVALTLAQPGPLAIAGIMLLGWVIVAALEWAAWRGEPHYGSGLPPRYYVPSVNLPPAQPLDRPLERAEVAMPKELSYLDEED